MVRRAADFTNHLNFEKTVSIGLRSGLYGGRYATVALAASTAQTNSGDLVAAEIVHDHDVTRSQGGREMLFDPAAKEFAVDRTVNDQRRGQSRDSQGGQKGGGLPVSMRDVTDQARSFQGPSARANHVRLHPGFVEEHEPFGGDAVLPQFPGRAAFGHVGPLLFARSQDFFFTVSRNACSARHKVLRPRSVSNWV